MIGSLDSLNSDCRSFSNMKIVTALKKPRFALWAERQPSVRLAIYTSLLDRLAVVNRHDGSNWMGSFDCLNLSNKLDCRSFSNFETFTGCRSFSHSKTLNIKYVVSTLPLPICWSFQSFGNLILHIFLIIIRCSGMFRDVRDVPCSWFYRRPFPVYIGVPGY